MLADQLMENGATHADTLKALNATLPGYVLLDPEQARAIRYMLVHAVRDEDSDAFIIAGEFLVPAIMAARATGLWEQS